jgi:hypothetical protein
MVIFLFRCPQNKEQRISNHQLETRNYKSATMIISTRQLYGRPKCRPYSAHWCIIGGRPSPATTRGDANHCCIPLNIWCSWHLQVYRLGLTSLPQYIMGIRTDSTWAVLALGPSILTAGSVRHSESQAPAKKRWPQCGMTFVVGFLMLRMRNDVVGRHRTSFRREAEKTTKYNIQTYSVLQKMSLVVG